MLKGLMQARVTGPEDRVQDAMAAIQQVLSTGEFKKGYGKGKGQVLKHVPVNTGTSTSGSAVIAPAQTGLWESPVQARVKQEITDIYAKRNPNKL